MRKVYHSYRESAFDFLGELVPAYFVADQCTCFERQRLGGSRDTRQQCVDFGFDRVCLGGMVGERILATALEVHRECAPQPPICPTQRGDACTCRLLCGGCAYLHGPEQRTAVIRVFGIEFENLQLGQQEFRNGDGIWVSTYGQGDAVTHRKAADKNVDLAFGAWVVEQQSGVAIEEVEFSVGDVAGSGEHGAYFGLGFGRDERIDIAVTSPGVVAVWAMQGNGYPAEESDVELLGAGDVHEVLGGLDNVCVHAVPFGWENAQGRRPGRCGGRLFGGNFFLEHVEVDAFALAVGLHTDIDQQGDTVECTHEDQ